MSKVKRVLCATVIIGAFLFPQSVMAAAGSGSVDNQKSVSSPSRFFASLLGGFTNFLLGPQQTDDRSGGYSQTTSHYLNDYATDTYTTNTYGSGNWYDKIFNKDWDFEDWYEKYKDYCPDEESYDIWKKWFCY